MTPEQEQCLSRISKSDRVILGEMIRDADVCEEWGRNSDGNSV